MFARGSSVGALGCLSAAEHQALRAYKQPTLLGLVARDDDDDDDDDERSPPYTLVDSFDALPAALRGARTLVLVGALTAAQARAAHKPATDVDTRTVGEYVAFDELGQVARVRTCLRARLTNSPLTRPLDEGDCEVLERGGGADAPTLDALGLVLELDDTTPAGRLVDHRVCCRTASPNLVVPAMHASARTLYGASARELARASSVPLADELAFVLTDRTGVEDVRAACALVRRRLYIVGSAERLLGALGRHGPRPRTALMSRLCAPPLPPASAALPMPLLQAIDDDDDDDDDASAQSIEPPYTLLYLGATNATELMLHTHGVAHAPDAPVHVNIAELHAHLERYLNGTRPMLNFDDDDDDMSSSTTCMTLNVDEPSSTLVRLAPTVFSPAHIDERLLGRLRADDVDWFVKQRLWALAHVAHEGTLGDDVDDAGYVERCFASYPSGFVVDDADAESAALTMRTHEALVVYLLAVTVKDAADDWFVRAEHTLFVRRAERAGKSSSAATTAELARAHAAAVRAILADVDAVPDDDAEADAEGSYGLFIKLAALRRYLVECLASS
jgi:hypothetical protein